jgi:predicted DCC family thiol-disulfide oxidoreductase YuxK
LDILPLDLVSIDVINQWEANPLWSVDSIKVISQGQLWIKSAAIAQIMREAQWFAQPLRLLFVVPHRLLDVLYDWVARHRKSDTCELPQKS